MSTTMDRFVAILAKSPLSSPGGVEVKMLKGLRSGLRLRIDCWRFPISWRRNCSRAHRVHTKPKILVAREIREALEHTLQGQSSCQSLRPPNDAHPATALGAGAISEDACCVVRHPRRPNVALPTVGRPSSNR
jgi:hypothetical protein